MYPTSSTVLWTVVTCVSATTAAAVYVFWIRPKPGPISKFVATKLQENAGITIGTEDGFKFSLFSGKPFVELNEVKTQEPIRIPVSKDISIQLDAVLNSLCVEWKWGRRTSGSDDGGNNVIFVDPKIFTNSLQLKVTLVEQTNTQEEGTGTNTNSTSLAPNEASTENENSPLNAKASSNSPSFKDRLMAVVLKEVHGIINTLTISLRKYSIQVYTSDSDGENENLSKNGESLMLGFNGVSLQRIFSKDESLKPADIGSGCDVDRKWQLTLEELYISTARQFLQEHDKDTEERKEEEPNDFTENQTHTQSFPVLKPFSWKVRIVLPMSYGLDDFISTNGMKIILQDTRMTNEVYDSMILKNGKDEICICTGVHQIDFLNRLLKTVLQMSSTPPTNDGPPPTDAQEENTYGTFSTPQPSPDTIPSPSPVVDNQIPMQLQIEWLSAVSLVLPNATKLSLCGLQLMLCSDNSELVAQMNEGIFLSYPNNNGGEEVAALLYLPASSRLAADGVKNEVCFGTYVGEDGNDIQMSNEDVVTEVTIFESKTKKIKDGVADLMDILIPNLKTGGLGIITKEAVSEQNTLEDANESQGATTKDPKDDLSQMTSDKDPKEKSSNWGVHVNGAIAVQWKDDLEVDGTTMSLNTQITQIHAESHNNNRILSLKIEEIAQLFVPGQISLTEPIRDISVICELDEEKHPLSPWHIDCHVGPVRAKLEEPPKEQKPLPDSEKEKQMREAGDSIFSSTWSKVSQPAQQMTDYARSVKPLSISPLKSISAGKEISTSFFTKRFAKVAVEDGNETHAVVVLPFDGIARLDSIHILCIDGKKRHIAVEEITAAVGPDANEEEANENTTQVPTPKPVATGGIRAAVSIKEVDHDMIGLNGGMTSAVVWPHDLSKIYGFTFGAKQIRITSGYSIFDWRRLRETGDQNREKRAPKKKISTQSRPNESQAKKPVRQLPFANIKPLEIKVDVTGEVGMKGSTLYTNEFKGRENTTVNDLVGFFAGAMITNIPGLVLNTEILGESLKDNAFTDFISATPVAGFIGGASSDAGDLVLSITQRAKKMTMTLPGFSKRGSETDTEVKPGAGNGPVGTAVGGVAGAIGGVKGLMTLPEAGNLEREKDDKAKKTPTPTLPVSSKRDKEKNDEVKPVVGVGPVGAVVGGVAGAFGGVKDLMTLPGSSRRESEMEDEVKPVARGGPVGAVVGGVAGAIGGVQGLMKPKKTTEPETSQSKTKGMRSVFSKS